MDPVNGNAAEMLKAATAKVNEPVARVVVELTPSGQITMHATNPNPLLTLGLLEMAKQSVIRKATGEASPIVPARLA